MRENKILDTRLHIALDVEPPSKANALFRDDPNNQAHLANQLLIYDRIIIPTHDFGILPILISWFGYGVFREILQIGTIQFLRNDSLLGYAGGGNGISQFKIQSAPGKPLQWWQETVFGDLGPAIELQLKHYCPSLAKADREALLVRLLELTTTPKLENEFFIKNVVHESYYDILANRELVEFVPTCEKALPGQISLERLPSVAANQLRLRNLNDVRDAIDVILRVAEINLGYVLAHSCDRCDYYSPSGAERILLGKLMRLGAKPEALSNLVELLELNDLPDVGAAVAAGDVSLRDVWQLHLSDNATRFRHWFRSSDTIDSRVVKKEFVRVLQEGSIADSLPSRLVRFAVTTALGCSNPLVGLGVDVIDSFFLDKWVAGYAPRLFLDDLRKLPGLIGKRAAGE